MANHSLCVTGGTDYLYNRVDIVIFIFFVSSGLSRTGAEQLTSQTFEVTNKTAVIMPSAICRQRGPANTLVIHPLPGNLVVRGCTLMRSSAKANNNCSQYLTSTTRTSQVITSPFCTVAATTPHNRTFGYQPVVHCTYIVIWT